MATGVDSGAVYLFAGSGSNWTQVVHLTPNAPQAGQTFGEEVGWNGQRLLVGAPNYDSSTLQSSGAVYVFSMIGSTWVQRQFITDNDAAAGGYFGAGAGVVFLALTLICTSEQIWRASILKSYLLGVANLVAAIGFAVFGPVHWVAAAAMAAGAFAGGWCGPPLVRRIPPNLLRVTVALAGFGLAVWLAVR